MISQEDTVWNHLKYGKITETVTDSVDNIPCEISYYDCNGNVIGFWSYGSFDPAYPYMGE